MESPGAGARECCRQGLELTAFLAYPRTLAVATTPYRPFSSTSAPRSPALGVPPGSHRSDRGVGVLDVLEETTAPTTSSRAWTTSSVRLRRRDCQWHLNLDPPGGIVDRDHFPDDDAVVKLLLLGPPCRGHRCNVSPGRYAGLRSWCSPTWNGSWNDAQDNSSAASAVNAMTRGIGDDPWHWCS